MTGKLRQKSPRGTRAKRQSTPSDISERLQWLPLDKGSFTPLYFQIQTQLLQQIQAGNLRPGDSVPGEEELTRIFNVSRMTCRQALQSLKNQGYAHREKGRGTFVIQPKVEKDTAHLLGFTAEMRTLGMVATSKVLGVHTVAAAPEVAERLGIAVGAPVLHLERQRFANAEPVLLEEVWISMEQFPGIEDYDYSKHSLYEILRERFGIRAGSADEVLEARPATRREADLLQVAPRASLLVISRTLHNMEGRPVETGISAYRGDRYRAMVRIPATEVI